MRKRILSVVLTVLMLAAMVPSAMAATLEEINQDEVFLKQQQRGTCTLASTAMMLRRAAMLNGDENWAQITEASCREAFWLSGRGLPYNFSYGEMTVGHDRLPGGQASSPTQKPSFTPVMNTGRTEPLGSWEQDTRTGV